MNEEQVAYLRAEIERLRAQRVIDNEDLSRAFDLGLAAGERRERDAVFEYLSELAVNSDTVEMERVLFEAAGDIHRGEHRREEEK